MSSKFDNRLTAARLEIAVQICLSFPSLYNKLRCVQLQYIRGAERDAAIVLVNLLNIDPVVKWTLDFYYKRELSGRH